MLRVLRGFTDLTDALPASLQTNEKSSADKFADRFKYIAFSLAQPLEYH